MAEIHTLSCTSCTRCGASMRLFGIEPHPAIDQMALRTYVCIDCDAVQTDLISTRADADQGALTDLADQGALNGGELTISIVGHLTNSGFDDRRRGSWARPSTQHGRG